MLCIDLTGDLKNTIVICFALQNVPEVIVHIDSYFQQNVHSIINWLRKLSLDIFYEGSLPVLRMIVVKLMRSYGMILDCPHTWDCSTYNIVEH